MDSFDTMQFSTWRTMSRHYDSIADRAYRLIVYARMGGVEAGARDRWVLQIPSRDGHLQNRRFAASILDLQVRHLHRLQVTHLNEYVNALITQRT